MEAEQITDPEAKKKKLNEALPRISLHELRHTAASLLVAEGMDILTICARLGHSKPSVTLDIYSHALPEGDKRASDTLERIYNVNQPVVRTELIKVSNDEKMLLERLRNAPEHLQELFMDMLQGNYSESELYSIKRKEAYRS